MQTPHAHTTGDARERSVGVRTGWACFVMGIAVFVAVASIACGSPVPTRTNEASIVFLPDDRTGPSIAEPSESSDPLDCTDHVATAQLDQVIVSKWSPDSSKLAVARAIIVPSRLTITGYEEDPVLSILDVSTNEVREIGQGNRPEWSGTGTFLSFWKNDGYLHILQGDKNVGTLEVSNPDARWVDDVLYYWYAEEIRTWDRGVTQTVSRVASELVPRYPRDDAHFSADGERFTITRYSTDGTTERYIGATATGDMAALDQPDITYIEWSPRGQTLLMRSQDRVALRDGDGTVKSELLANLPGPVHGWSSDGRLLLGILSPTMPAGNSWDRFWVWDGSADGGFATLPNVFGARAFSPDGRWFTGVSRTAPEKTQLELYRCGVTIHAAAAIPRADTASRSRLQRIASDGHRFVRPVAGMIVQFLQGRHTGVDVAAPFGSLIFAAEDGVVNAVGWVPVGGRRVCVMHEDGLESCAYHSSLALVAVGDRVVQGQPVALVGLTGQTGGPHVHWEVRRNGMFVNPLDQ
jgi:hypothetical protein